MTKLSVDSLRLKYGEAEILKGISLHLEEGEILVLLGPSGSGKTTLLRAIAGLEQPNVGRIIIGDRAVFDSAARSEIPPEKRNLGLVFQSYALWPHRTVSENVGYGLRLRKFSTADREKLVADALDQLGLGALGARYPHQLSGGQQQRVAVARALVYSPPVILMDEPLSNLDAKLRDEAKAWLRSLIRERRLSAIIVTHDQSEALAIADRIALLSEGRLEQVGRPLEIYQNPGSLVTAEFFGSNNRLNGVIQMRRNKLALIGGPGWQVWGEVKGELREGDAAVAVIRIERVRLTESPEANKLNLPLVTSMFSGDRWQHAFDFHNSILRVNGDSELREGSYDIWLPCEGTWIFPDTETSR